MSLFILLASWGQKALSVSSHVQISVSVYMCCANSEPSDIKEISLL